MGRRAHKGLGQKDRPELRGRRQVFDRAKVKEQAYNPSLSVLNLSKKYGGRLEAACAHALPRLGSPRYRHLKAILDSNLDDPAAPMRKSPAAARNPGPRGHVRGADLQGIGGAMIDEETRRKLRAGAMGEMVEALDLQEADRAHRWRCRSTSGSA